MVGVGHGAVNFRMEGVDWSSGGDPVDDSFALEKGMRGRGWRVVILKCVEKLGTGEEVKSGRARNFEIQITG
jgi:hypothetical protein